jgi:hypothetical protein
MEQVGVLLGPGAEVLVGVDLKLLADRAARREPDVLGLVERDELDRVEDVAAPRVAQDTPVLLVAQGPVGGRLLLREDEGEQEHRARILTRPP